MKAKPILIGLSILILVLAAFYLGQRTQVSPKKREHVKKVSEPRVAKKIAVVPEEAAKPQRSVKVAIVIDDFGYTMSNLPVFFSINEPLTLSILPNVRHSRDVAAAAKEHGYEVILHMPMEAIRKDVKEEADTLRPGDSKKSVEARLSKAVETVPGLKGLSNHMGSKATEDKKLMTEVLTYLKKHGLYFFDSLTSEKSVGPEVAGSLKMPFAKRDMFLDNSNKVDSIEIELADLEKLAFKRGRAIAICHDRKNTATALAKVMPQMVKDGVEFVYLSDMVK